MAMPLIIKRGALRLLLQEELDYIFSQGLVFRSVSTYRCSVLTLTKNTESRCNWSQSG